MYAGTKEGAKQLVNDAAEIDKSINKNDLSYANLVKAIHAVQEKMDITGTTQKEAEHTITGSLSMVKSAWQNLMPALIEGGDSFDQCIDNLIYSAEKFSDNITPAIEKALGGVGTLIEKLAPKIETQFPVLVDTLLPPLLSAATSLLKSLIIALPGIVKTIAKEIPDILKEVGLAIGEAFGLDPSKVTEIGSALEKAGKKISKFVPALLGLAGALFVLSKIKSIGGALSGLFGKSGGGVGGQTNIFSDLAKTSPKTILKGMANIAIILGGITAIGAAFALVAPYIAKLSDTKSLLKVAAIITVLGIIGTVLAKFAGIVGNIPILTVVKGLANMAIMLVGMTALGAAFAWVAPYIAALADTKSLLKVAAIITVLGFIGTVLSVFAAIAGSIPIPVVLTGLANIALVVVGLTALIAAYAALGEIPGFNEFITKGGDVLANLFGQLGKIVGSIIGGIGEGVTNSLPKIGENLSAFADSVAPMLATFSGTDVSGVGEFLKSLGSFILLMTGEKLLSFITGGINYAELGTQLTAFGDSASGFFATVATYPDNGFDNATKLFDCLAGLKSLPKEGGVVGWFTGSINYENLASGLNQLASDKVTGFFNTVSELKQEGFDNATKLFDCLAGLKSLPKDGGVIGWFCGDVDYSKIASGLEDLSGDGVKNFFAMAAGLKQAGFDNAIKLFDCLAGMGNLTSGDSFWERLKDGIFGGDDDETMLSKIAKDLGTFATNAKPFFEQVNNLKVNNIDALFNSLKKLETVSVDLQDTVTAEFSKIVSTIKEKCEAAKKSIEDTLDKIESVIAKTNLSPAGATMMDSFISGINSRKTAVINAISSITSDINRNINSTISGGNWALKEFGSETRLKAYEYAHGTGGHPGGNAIVNDGRGAELVQMPNGRMFLANGRNVFLPNAPKGMKVLDAQNTARLFGKNAPTFRYANGTGDIDVFAHEKGSSLASEITKKFADFSNSSGFALHAGKAAVSTVQKAMGSWGDKLIDEYGAAGLGDYVASAGVNQWRSTVARALRMEGQYSAANVKRTLYQMQTESGGNPRAINLWDSNAKKGIPSKGLLQVIDPTFKAYARPGYNKNSYDPLSNILASIRYATSRYGSLAKAYQGHGYASGTGSIDFPNYTPSSSIRSRSVTENNTYSPSFSITINGAEDTRDMERKVKRFVKEAMDETFRSMQRKSPRLQEV